MTADSGDALRTRLQEANDGMWQSDLVRLCHEAASVLAEARVSEPPKPLKLYVSKEWCERMAKLEGDSDVTAGSEATFTAAVEGRSLQEPDHWQQLGELLKTGGMNDPAFLYGQVQALLEAQDSRPAPPLDWQPIETAPKDGTEMLLTDGAYKRTGYWARRRECWSIDMVAPIRQPTHWASIPATLPAKET